MVSASIVVSDANELKQKIESTFRKEYKRSLAKLPLERITVAHGPGDAYLAFALANLLGCNVVSMDGMMPGAMAIDVEIPGSEAVTIAIEGYGVEIAFIGRSNAE